MSSGEWAAARSFSAIVRRRSVANVVQLVKERRQQAQGHVLLDSRPNKLEHKLLGMPPTQQRLQELRLWVSWRERGVIAALVVTSSTE